MMQYPPFYPWFPSPQVKLAPPPEEGPAAKTPHGLFPDRVSVVIATIIIVVTLLALALAILAPSLSQNPRSVVPSNWSKVYDRAISNDGKWDTAAGCGFTTAGLDIVGQDGSSNSTTTCDFRPSSMTDLTSQGFLLDVGLAPSARVSGNQVPIITIGDSSTGLLVAFDQQGRYDICTPDNAPTCATGSTAAWHSDGYVANSIQIRYLPDQHQLTLYANGQSVGSANASIPAQAQIALGTVGNGEALFTHVTLFSASSVS